MYAYHTVHVERTGTVVITHLRCDENGKEWMHVNDTSTDQNSVMIPVYIPREM